MPTCTTESTPPLRKRRKATRPGELIDAALNLFIEKGFAATRSEEVAQRAGVSKGTLFLYFATKEDLFKAVVRENIGSLFPSWTEEMENFTGSCAEMLTYALTSWWERVGQTKAGGIAKLVISEAQNFPDIAIFYQQEVITPGTQLLKKILQRGVDRQEFRALDLDQAVFTLVAPMIFLMLWKNSMSACASSASEVMNPEQFIALQTDVLLNGLKAQA
jgi:AcrR family transcriptional regulator